MSFIGRRGLIMYGIDVSRATEPADPAERMLSHRQLIRNIDRDIAELSLDYDHDVTLLLWEGAVPAWVAVKDAKEVQDLWLAGDRLWARAAVSRQAERDGANYDAQLQSLVDTMHAIVSGQWLAQHKWRSDVIAALKAKRDAARRPASKPKPLPWRDVYDAGDPETWAPEHRYKKQLEDEELDRR